MNLLIPFLNHAGDAFLRFATPMAWQCALLVSGLALLDFALRNRVRAALRYGLWLLLLVKLVLPPTLALPTSAAYWLPGEKQRMRPAPTVLTTRVEISEATTHTVISADIIFAPIPGPTLRAPAIVFLVWMSGVIALGLWLVQRACFVARLVRRAKPASSALRSLLDDCRKVLGIRHPVAFSVSQDVAGPAVCGLWRPVVLLPASMTDGLSSAQLRSVLLHELAHIRRHDLWVNHAQCLLQILYWWHPLVWFGNAAIRRTREQAVDEQVMLALGREAEDYPATLLEIAKAAVPRPALALGLVGILEHRRALKTRIRRLIERPLPSRATLGWRQWLVILLVACAALPMNAARSNRQQAAAATPAPPSVQRPIETPSDDPTALKSNQTFQAGASRSRASLLKKLEALRLDEFSASNEPLSNVVARLAKAARTADAERRGVNFVFSEHPDPVPPAIDPGTGLPLANADDEDNRLGDCRITIQPPITDISMRQVLDAIVSVASCQLHYSVQDWGVLFLNRKPLDALHTRWFKVDTNVFAKSIRDTVGARRGGESADGEEMIAGVRTLLNNAGVEFDPPKSVLYNDRLGMLMVRATLRDFELIEQLIQVVNMTPAQVMVEAKFVLVVEGEPASAEVSAVLGFDIAAKTGTTATSVRPPNAGAKAGATLTNLPAPVWTGILTPGQFRSVMTALEKQQGSQILASPRILTSSGRQAQIKTVEVRTIVTDLEKAVQPGGEPHPIAESFELGPILDVVPFVQADGLTIQLTIIPTLREFIGYDLESSKKVGTAAGISGKIPLPVFRTRQAVSSAIVWDGQTVVLGLGAASDPPQGGGAGIRKNLLVFITASLIDQAGNRIHTDEDMPFRKDRVPPQKSK